ncbi:ParB N-terminal domain-containing protein [Candidatus Saccharibacteria bacterium]|nr:ParB N-terminal domain-containing protein [Candidatus Saccharibacteria bacterium]
MIDVEGELLPTDVIDESQASLIDFLNLNGVEVVGLREGGLVDCYVPVELIDNEEVPVKEHYVESLAAQMDREAEKKGGAGQLTPVVLGLIEGESLLKIVDGFHRSAAQKRRGQSQIYSTVMHSDWDDLYDTRIFTAKDHAQVRFSRVVIWMKEIWELSPFSEHMTLEQAVLLQRFDSSGARLTADTEVVEGAKEWVSRKETQWDIAALTIRDYIKISETVDPALVEATREKRSSHELAAPTQDIIKVFSQEIPNNYELQNIVLDAAKARNLKTALVRAVCDVVSGCESNAEAARKIQEIEWDKLEPKTKKQQSARIFNSNDPRLVGGRTLEGSHTEITKTIERINKIIESGEPLSAEQAAKLQELQAKIEIIKVSLGRLATRVSDLQDLAPESDTQKDELQIPAKKTATTSPSSDSRATKPIAKSSRSLGTDLPRSRVDTRPGRSSSGGRSMRSSSDHFEEFEKELKAYLNGRSPDGPIISTRSEARRAKRIIEEGNFKNKKRLEEVRGDIDEARSARPSR